MEQKQTKTEQAAGCGLMLILVALCVVGVLDSVNIKRHEQRIRRIEQKLSLDVEYTPAFVPRVKAEAEESR